GTVTALAGQAAGPNRNTYQGVTDSRITVVVGIQHQPCGQDPSQVMAKALPNPDPEGTTRAAVDYFNKHALAAFGHDIPASAQGQFSNGYYGRQMQAVIADDHGEFCPEQSKADAQQAMDTIKPFAVMGGSDEWDDEAFSRRLIRIDGDPLTDQFFVQHRPYFWCPITGASKVNVLLSQYAAKYLKDSNSTNTGDPTTASK